jgi:hypothetical protein
VRGWGRRAGELLKSSRFFCFETAKSDIDASDGSKRQRSRRQIEKSFCRHGRLAFILVLGNTNNLHEQMCQE